MMIKLSATPSFAPDATLAKIREQVHFIARDSIENALAREDRLLASNLLPRLSRTRLVLA